MISEGLSRPGEERLRPVHHVVQGCAPAKRWDQPFLYPSLCLRKKRAKTTYIFAAAVEVKPQVMEEPPPCGPAQHLPTGFGKRLPGPDGRVNLSGAQGGDPFHGQGGAAAENALVSFAPAFLGGRPAWLRN